MKEFLIYIGKSGICISIFLLIYQLFLRRATFFRFNRLYLMGALFLSFVLPLFKNTYTVIQESLTLQATNMGMGEISGEVIMQTSSFNYWTIVFGIYITGCMFVLSRKLHSYYKLYTYFLEGKKIKEKDINTIQNENIISPFTFFNKVFWNKEAFSETEQNIILRHETTHIRQKHWIDLCCSECALILHWFNPMMWVYVYYQKENHEFLADKAVLNTGVSTSVYKAVLINQQLGRPVFSFTNSFNFSNNLNRLTMMKRIKTHPLKKLVVLILLPVFGVFFNVFAEPVYVYQDDADTVKVEIRKESVLQLEAEEIYVIIDGVAKSVEDFEALNPEGIQEITVLKDDSAIKLYGEKGKNGVLIVVTKMFANNYKAENTIKNQWEVKGYGATKKMTVSTDTIVVSTIHAENVVLDETYNDVLLIIDGKEVTPEALAKLDANDIESILVLKDKGAIEKYGQKGKNGVIEIITKSK